MTAPQAFRRLLSEQKIVVAPGCYDCISARVIEKLDFKAVYLTGYGIEASRLGRPDIGLASMVEVVDHARNVRESVSLPVIADADTGYGDVLSVWRTAREFEKAGVAGIHLEDQMMPKKCGGLPGKIVISREEMVDKIRAARDALDNKEFVIIGRTDSRLTLGMEESKRRIEAYLKAGAELVLLGDRHTVAELEEMGKTFPQKLLICAGILGWEETILSVNDYAQMGIKMLIYPVTGLYAAVKAVMMVYKTLREKEGLSEADLIEAGISFDEANELLGFSDWTKKREAYTPK
ncbi:oxaloacetate decarboxylase [Chloroflexota bacterium]